MMKEEREKCPIETTLDVIGGKWKVLILWYLLEEEKRFSELERHLPHITQNMRAQQLRELEEDGLLVRTVFPVVPPKVEYALTSKGKSLSPILMDMLEWGNRHLIEIEYRDQASNLLCNTLSKQLG
jgi:DNA-binding HxlR family transcriptional regulator